MGFLDWLTDGIGSDAGGWGANAPSPGSMPPMPQAKPPSLPYMEGANDPSNPTVPPPPVPPPSPPFPAGGDPMTAGGEPPNGPGLPPGMPVPMPQPRPPGADIVPPAAAIPPAAAPTAGVAPPMAPTTPQFGAGMIGGGDGRNPNLMRSMVGSLGASLKAAGESAGKSKFQAFAGGAGAGLEGGQTASDKGYDQRLKALTLAVTAQANGDKAEYNKNYAEYLKGKLESDKSDMTPSGKKGTAWNKPDSQKFIDAQNAMAKDPEIKASQKMLEQLGKSADPGSPELTQATAAHNALIAKKQQLYLTGVGLDPAQIQKNMQTPPGTPQNPHVVKSKQDFDIYVKPGQAYVNPKDGQVYIRKQSDAPSAAAPDGEVPKTPVQPPGPRPNTVAKTSADDEED